MWLLVGLGGTLVCTCCVVGMQLCRENRNSVASRRKPRNDVPESAYGANSEAYDTNDEYVPPGMGGSFLAAPAPEPLMTSVRSGGDLTPLGEEDEEETYEDEGDTYEDEGDTYEDDDGEGEDTFENEEYDDEEGYDDDEYTDEYDEETIDHSQEDGEVEPYSATPQSSGGRGWGQQYSVGGGSY